jgi:hypothetical protein
MNSHYFGTSYAPRSGESTLDEIEAPRELLKRKIEEFRLLQAVVESAKPAKDGQYFIPASVFDAIQERLTA